MEARAISRYIPTSPRKMRLVIDSIRGKAVNDALHILHFSPKHAAKAAEKVLRSAVANLQNKDEAGRMEPSDLIVKEAFVDGGMVIKRISPAPMGRAYRIRKRSNHITIVVASKPAKAVQPSAATAKQKTKRAAGKPAAAAK
jgi:large subunit ribosomal protein L22